MKKISLIIFTVILNLISFSCTTNDLADDQIHLEQATGDEDGDIIPPPPTPTDGNGVI